MHTTKRPLTSIPKGSHNKKSTSSKGIETEKADLFTSTFQEPKLIFTHEDANFDVVSRKNYFAALNYINNFHNHVNSKLREQSGEHGDTKSSDEHCFKFPIIPNYSLLFPKFLNKPHQTCKDTVAEQPIKKVIKKQEANKIDEKLEDLVEDIKDQEDPKNKNKIHEKQNKVDEKPSRDILLTKHVELNGCLKHSSISEKPDIPKNVKLPAIPETFNFSKLNECVLQELFTYDKNEKETITYTEKHVELKKASFHVVDIQPEVFLNSMCNRSASQDFFTQTKKRSSEPESRVMLEKSLFGSVNIQPQHISKLNEKHNIRSTKDTSKVGPRTQKKVKEMFENISKDQSVTVDSDSDSEIMDDEQFEMLSQCRYPESRSEAVLTKHKKNCRATASEKSHPLKLNSKDLPKLNEKILNAIGIFTEGGDIRPGIIDVIEQHRLAKSNDRRNKQFRVKRQWDIQIHLQPRQADCSSLSSISSSSSIKTETYCREVEERKQDSSRSY
ncbi:unnamed protein product [Acanthoscelides obtectus]|uniref:Uncharacterized protein n=1 Tax=Acanthoscelides obtectus TaxID=200917 RepID=A0A9P0PG28_ACAOB|nr:unnamed protein product [Acanthoscelides obtectus]CAK1674995.1 hypothetical protein AOBTE_LOCUS29847 [Acanthoscelides obtectus]